MMRLSRLTLAAVFAITVTAPRARAVEPDKLLPADSDTVYFVNVKQILESDVFKKYALEQLKQTLAGEEAKKFWEELGVDPLKDVSKVWAGSSGMKQSDLKVLVILHGKFDPAKLTKTAEDLTKKESDKFSKIKDGTTTMFKFQPEQGNPFYGTVVDETTVIGGTDKKLVAAALKQAADQNKAPISAELTALVKKMDEKVSVFAGSVVKGKFDNLKFPPQLPIDVGNLEETLPKTDTVSISVKVSGDINLEVVIGMKDDAAAGDMGKSLGKLIDNVKALAPLFATEPKTKPLVDVVKTIKTDVKKKDVIITGKMTNDNIDKMVNPAP